MEVASRDRAHDRLQNRNNLFDIGKVQTWFQSGHILAPLEDLTNRLGTSQDANLDLVLGVIVGLDATKVELDGVFLGKATFFGILLERKKEALGPRISEGSWSDFHRRVLRDNGFLNSVGVFEEDL